MTYKIFDIVARTIVERNLTLAKAKAMADAANKNGNRYVIFHNNARI